MGYTSTIVIAVKKEVIARDLIDPQIPKCLKEIEYKINDQIGAAYWELDSWKWYHTYQEVQEIERWFDSMEFEDFGAIRLGEDDNDSQTWGSPYDFDICINRWISHPAQD